jgi:hypothetical protein
VAEADCHITSAGGTVTFASASLPIGRAAMVARANTRESAIRRYEDGGRIAPTLYLTAVREALESAGGTFVEENGEGPGVRLRKR